MLLALALIFALPSLALIAFGVMVDHAKGQREKRSRQIRAELIEREEDRHQEIKVIGGHRVGPTIEAHHGKKRVGL